MMGGVPRPKVGPRPWRIKPAAMGMAFIMCLDSKDEGIIDLLESTPVTRHAGEMRQVLQNLIDSPPERPNYAEAESLLERIAREEGESNG